MEQPRLKIGIIGIGMVGTPLKRYFEELKGYVRGKDLYLFDIDSRKGFSDDINYADVIFVCVPTPKDPDGKANIGAVESAVSGIRGEKIVIIKSTVPPGTTEFLQERYPRHKILFNPEFLTERRAWEGHGESGQANRRAYRSVPTVCKRRTKSPSHRVLFFSGNAWDVYVHASECH